MVSTLAKTRLELLGRTWSVRLLGPVLIAGTGCNYLVKNDHHLVYSRPQVGRDRFVVVHNYNIHYVEEGEGPPVLLIPGAFTTYRVWNRILPGLSRQNRVLVVDYLGVGDSDKPENGFRYSVEEQADVLANMIGTLGLVNVTVMGVSYGGAIALNLAARYPDQVHKVISIEGGALITPEVLKYGGMGSLLRWPVLGDITWAFMKSGLFDEMTARSVMGAAWDALSPEDRQEITGFIAANIQTSSRSSWINIYEAITRRIDFTRALRNMRAPVLYLYGQNSKYRGMAEVNVAILRGSIPDIEIVSLPNGIHDLHLQYPDMVTQIVLAFLGQNGGGETLAGGFAARRTGEWSGVETGVD